MGTFLDSYYTCTGLETVQEDQEVYHATIILKDILTTLCVCKRFLSSLSVPSAVGSVLTMSQ